MVVLTTARPSLPRTTRARRSALSKDLDGEWQRLRHHPRTLAAVNEWGLLAVPVIDLQDLLRDVGARPHGQPDPDPAARNERLRRLLDRARHDDLAARIVLQRLVPGLVVELARRRDRDQYPGGRFEELIGSAWISIRVAYVAPDSPCVAGRLLDDAWYRAFKAPRRRRSAQEVVVDPSTFQQLPEEIEPTPFEELADIVGEARRRGLDPDDVQLIKALVRAESAGRLAAERRVTARTGRNHRDRVVHSLRRLAAA